MHLGVWLHYKDQKCRRLCCAASSWSLQVHYLLALPAAAQASPESRQGVSHGATPPEQPAALV